MRQKGRSSVYFTTINQLYSTWNEEELAHQISFMPCLIGLIKAESFIEAMTFANKINSLQGNKVKGTKKYLVFNVPNIDQSIMQNFTGYIHVHIIWQGDKGGF